MHPLPVPPVGVEMFAGHQWYELGDECSHRCRHNATSYVANGDTVATHHLVECDVCGCRAWLDRRHRDDSTFWRAVMVWRLALVPIDDEP